jgi:hypothetical protein
VIPSLEVGPINPRNIILSGVPRSGSTLACFLLNKLPDVVALHEPMQVWRLKELPDRARVLDEIEAFLEESRERLLSEGLAPSKHIDGRVPDNPFTDVVAESGLRTIQDRRDTISFEGPLSEAFVLVIKHPVAFAALLEDLVTRFRCFATIRNPLAVLGSWNSIDLPFQRGHAPIGEALDPPLGRALAQIPAVHERQLHLLGWFYDRFRRFLPRESVLRYEDVVETGGGALEVVTGRAADLAEPLEDRNGSQLYDRALMQDLGARLLASEGPYWDFYSRDDVARLLDA